MQIRDPLRLLEGLENGTLHSADGFAIAERLDDFLLFCIFRYLREKYPSNSPDGQGVMARLLEISQNHPTVVQKSKSGEKDILKEWFDETFTMNQFFSDPEKLIHTVVDKLEG